MQADRGIDEYASRQYGVFSLDQARRATVTDNMIQYRLRTGAWVRLAPGVYAVGSAPPSWERQMAAAVLSEPRAIASGSAAAYLHRFGGFEKAKPEILVPTGSNARSSIARVQRSIWFDDIETVRAGGFKATNEAETLLLLAGRLTVDRVESLLDERLASGSVVVDDFERIRRRVANGRVRGAARLFPLLDERSADSWEPPGNQLERHLGRLANHPDSSPDGPNPSAARLTSEQRPFVSHGRCTLDLGEAQRPVNRSPSSATSTDECTR